ncbi:hypothetical protein CerSpe_029980 [Prunus speciosa]
MRSPTTKLLVLQAKCDSVSGRISAVALGLCMVLACQPRLFVADVGLGAAALLEAAAMEELRLKDLVGEMVKGLGGWRLEI